MRRRAVLGLLGSVPVLAAPVLVAPVRAAEPLPAIRIGVLGDRSGVGAVTSGPDQAVAARMAVEDYGTLSAGYPIEILTAEFARRPDDAVEIARKWFDQDNVAAIVDLPGTAAPVLVQSLAGRRDRSVLNTGSFNAALTGASCVPTATHWLEDTRALTMAMTLGLAAEGIKTWFLVVPDDVTGLAFRAGATEAIEATGGRIVAIAVHPADARDYAVALRDARDSGADAVGLCAVGAELRRQIGEARALGVFDRVRAVCAYGAGIADIHALTPAIARGLRLISGFYWNQSERTRPFAMRFNAMTARMPDKPHAATYAAVFHFLRSVETLETIGGAALNTGMRRDAPYFFGVNGRLRVDGRLMLPMQLYQVKAPDQATAPWDYYMPIRTVPALDIFRTPKRGGCPTPV